MADKLDTLIGELGKLTGNIENLVKVVSENNAAILSKNGGSGNSRYSSGIFGYSNILTNSKNTEQIFKMFQLAQKTNTKTSGIGGRIFQDLIHGKRNLDADRISFEKDVKTFQELRKELLKEIGAKTITDTSELLEKAIKKIERLKKETQTTDKQYEKKKKELEKGLNDEQKGKVEDFLKTSDVFSGKGKKAVDDYNKSIEESAKLLGVEPDLLKDTLKYRDKNIKAQTKLTEIEDKTNKLGSTGIDVLNQQMRLRESSFRMMEDGFRRVKGGFKDVFNIGKQFASAWMKIDTASSNFARSIGMGSAGMNALRRNSISRIANTQLSDKYGVGMEDLVKLQAGYSTAIGRNIGLSDLDQENAIAMGVVMGERGGQLAASLENFGLSYSDAAKTAGKMFQDAGKYGLCFEKYSENFLQNIKIAQNYTFKNGLKGLESMAKKATAIKLDMQQVSAFADKVGTLQGSVETAAKLQVLGGPFAQFSDPLGMLNESMTDMEGLMDRFQNMVGGLGRFDEATGQVTVSAFNKQRIKAAAEAMGMSYDQVMESVQAQGRRNYIASNLKGSWSDDEREFIMNTASVKEGKPMLSYIDASGKRVEKDVSKMSHGELQIARQQNQSQSDNIKNIAQDTRNMAQQITGVQNKADAVRAKTFEGIHKVVSNGISTINRNLGIIIGLMSIYGVGKAVVGGIGGGIGQMIQGGRAVKWLKDVTGGGAGVFGNLRTIAFGKEAPKGGFGDVFKGASLGEKAVGKYGQLIGRQANSKLLKGLTKGSALKTVKLGAGIGIAGEIAGEIAGSVIKNSNEKNIQQGKYAKDSKQDLNHQAWASTLQWAGRGAALGGMFGLGPIGAAIGAGIGALGGGIAGLVNKKNTLKKNEARAAISKYNYNLSGDYNRKEMETILAAIKSGTGNTISDLEFKTFSKELQDKMLANGDTSLFPGLQNIAVSSSNGEFEIENANFTVKSGTFDKKVDKVQKANGGLLNGPSHSRGGMPILGSNIEVEGGEFVVNKRSTEKNLSLLNSINKMGNGGIVKPRKMADGGMLTVIPSLPVNNMLEQTSSSRKSEKQEISLNISGTIKLEGSGGKTLDITDDMLKNRDFIRKLTKLIEKQITVNEKGGNVVKKGLY